MRAGSFFNVLISSESHSWEESLLTLLSHYKFVFKEDWEKRTSHVIFKSVQFEVEDERYSSFLLLPFLPLSLTCLVTFRSLFVRRG